MAEVTLMKTLPMMSIEWTCRCATTAIRPSIGKVAGTPQMALLLMFCGSRVQLDTSLLFQQTAV